MKKTLLALTLSIGQIIVPPFVLAAPKRVDALGAYLQSETRRNARLARRADRASDALRKLATLAEVGLVAQGDRIQALGDTLARLDPERAITLARGRHAAYSREMAEHGIDVGAFDEGRLIEGLALVRQHGLPRLVLAAKGQLERAAATDQRGRLVLLQKPGDDFGGYPEGGSFSCGQFEVMVAMMALISCFVPELAWVAGAMGVAYAVAC